MKNKRANIAIILVLSLIMLSSLLASYTYLSVHLNTVTLGSRSESRSNLESIGNIYVQAVSNCLSENSSSIVGNASIDGGLFVSHPNALGNGMTGILAYSNYTKNTVSTAIKSGITSVLNKNISSAASLDGISNITDIQQIESSLQGFSFVSNVNLYSNSSLWIGTQGSQDSNSYYNFVYSNPGVVSFTLSGGGASVTYTITVLNTCVSYYYASVSDYFIPFLSSRLVVTKS